MSSVQIFKQKAQSVTDISNEIIRTIQFFIPNAKSPLNVIKHLAKYKQLGKLLNQKHRHVYSNYPSLVKQAQIINAQHAIPCH